MTLVSNDDQHNLFWETLANWAIELTLTVSNDDKIDCTKGRSELIKSILLAVEAFPLILTSFHTLEDPLGDILYRS